MNAQAMAMVLQRRRVHRGVFIAAGVYNLSWGIVSSVYPQWLFVWADMPLPRYPEIFACLAMVVALYGLLYFEVARQPEQGAAIARVGLLGKLLGPVGWLVLVAEGRWPASTFVLILTNDLIWWIPFALYLRDLRRFHRRREAAVATASAPRAQVLQPTDGG